MQSQAGQDSESRKRFFLSALQHPNQRCSSSLQAAHVNAAWSYLSKTVLKSKKKKKY
jgi:hypothetical protein